MVVSALSIVVFSSNSSSAAFCRCWLLLWHGMVQPTAEINERLVESAGAHQLFLIMSDLNPKSKKE
jgi:hypothetical protein